METDGGTVRLVTLRLRRPAKGTAGLKPVLIDDA
jgi:hypothetical protein